MYNNRDRNPLCDISLSRDGSIYSKKRKNINALKFEPAWDGLACGCLLPRLLSSTARTSRSRDILDIYIVCPKISIDEVRRWKVPQSYFEDNYRMIPIHALTSLCLSDPIIKCLLLNVTS